MIRTIWEAEDYLKTFYAKAAETTGKGITVDRMWPLLKRAGNPQASLKVVHIAGTSGKTSTAYFTAAFLKQAGCIVGLTVSPHVSSITERLQINGVPVSEQKFCSLLNEFMKLMGKNIDASYFEFLIVFVFWAFKWEQIDYAVVETGLGGLHDGTNVFKQSDKICVITDIGLDHQHVLGNTIAEIAAQKAGIIQLGNQVFMNKQSEEITAIIEKYSQQAGAQLHINKNTQHDLDLELPLFQHRNWSLAKKVYEFIARRDGLKELDVSELQQTKVTVPGRMQIIKRDNQIFVLDGAHNSQKMQSFTNSFRAKFPDTKAVVVLAMKTNKDYREIVPRLAPITSRAICTNFKGFQDTPLHAVDPHELAKLYEQEGIPAETADNLKDALELLKKRNEPVNIITGSFYILGDALKLLSV